MAATSSADSLITPPRLFTVDDGVAGDDINDDLDAYFEACRTSSPLSAADDDKEVNNIPFSGGNAGLATSLTEPTKTTADSHRSLSHSTPLQGSAPRPLLRHQRQAISNGGDDVASSVYTLGRLPATRTTSTPAEDLIAPLGRGAAGRDLANQLEHAELPLAPTEIPWRHRVHDGDAIWTSEAFRFHLPTPTTSSSSASPQSSSLKGKRESTTIITTRGRGSGGPSSPLLEGRKQRHARQRAVLFDVLCALRQHSTASCETITQESNDANPKEFSSFAKTWYLSESVKAEARAQNWPPCFLGALNQLLEAANDVAVVEAQTDLFECICTAQDAAAVSSTMSELSDVHDAAWALEVTGKKALKRLSRVVQQLHADFVQWVLQVQEYLIVICEDAFWNGGDDYRGQSSARNGRALVTWIQSTQEKKCEEDEEGSRVAQENVLPPRHSLLDVVLAVQENIIPLRRCRVLIEESGCYDGLTNMLSELQRKTHAQPEAKPPSLLHSSTSFVALAARLLDTLIIQASAVQDTSTMDLYRFYVMLLLYTAWPYVVLCTAAIFGFVRNIDPPVWRRQLPRLFRSSFAHVRIGNAHRHYPTDVLSLLLNCVGYYNAFETFSDTSGSTEDPAGSPQTHWKLVKGSRRAGYSNDSSGGRHKDMSEHHVALAALASARTFVLRSLSSFTRRKKQIALSRTPARPGTAGQAKKPQHEVNVGRSANGSSGAAAATSSASSLSRQEWRKRSVNDILHYIMYGTGERGEDEERNEEHDDATEMVRGENAGAAVVAYAQENQDVRRRVVQLPQGSAVPPPGTAGNPMPSLTPDGKHYLYYPTTIPLGFATMATEALTGELRWQQWQQQRSCAAERTEATADAPVQSMLSSSLGPATRRLLRNRVHHRRSSESDGDEEQKKKGNAASGSELLQRRALSLWTLRVSESTTAPDVFFENVYAPTDDDDFINGRGLLSRDDDDRQSVCRRRLSTSTHSRHTTGHRRTHQLWINITIPCARWVTSALLIPIGVTVQRLQERRLHDLFAVSLQAVRPRGLHSMTDNISPDGMYRGGEDGSSLLWRINEEEDSKITNVRGVSRSFADPYMPSLSQSPTTTAEAGGGLAMTSMTRRLSTPSSTTACSFLHALKLIVDVALCRDQERLVFGFLERLFKEPRWWTRRWVDGGADAFERLGTAAPTVTALFADALCGKRLGELVRLVVLPARENRKERTPTTITTPAASVSTIATDILDVFASFQLEFTLPAAFALILQPRDLSVYVQPVTNTLGQSFQTFFWQRRRRLYIEEAARMASSTVVSTTTVPATTIKMGVAFSDVWSYIFGYQCSLYYAQITLREHKKQLQQRDTQDFQLAQTMGQPRQRVTRHLQYVARGLGSAYYTLNFAVDTLLNFTQVEAMRAVYDLEHLLHKAMRASPGLHSCMELCHALDTLLLQLHFISFPARPAVALNAREHAMQYPAVEAVRSAVQRILEVALDPSRLPVSYISSITRNSVEALVAAVTAAGEHQGVLAVRLHPLRVMLTFNKYYGTPEETLSYCFR